MDRGAGSDQDSDADVERQITGLRTRSAGEDTGDPYEDVNLETLPDWWRNAIEEFEEHGLRPFRPPRFEDGALKHEVIESLETQYGVSIDFVGENVNYGDDWTVLADNTRLGTLPRRRDPAGYTVFEIDSDEFIEWFAARME